MSLLEKTTEKKLNSKRKYALIQKLKRIIIDTVVFYNLCYVIKLQLKLKIKKSLKILRSRIFRLDYLHKSNFRFATIFNAFHVRNMFNDDDQSKDDTKDKHKPITGKTDADD